MILPVNSPSPTDVTEWLSVALTKNEEARHLKIQRVYAYRTQPSSHSWVVEAFGVGSPERLFVKHHPFDALYQQEKHALQVLHSLAPSTEYCATPQLLVWSDERRLLVMRWLEGDPVGPLLRAAVGVFTSLANLEDGARIAHDIGRWLARFERLTTTPSRAPFPCEQMEKRINELVTFIGESGLPRFDARFAQAIEDTVRRHLGKMEDTYEHSLLHCDFWTGHIWRTHAKITVIDFGRCVEGPKGRDVAQFYLRLGDLALANPLTSSKKVAYLQDAYLRGYGGIDFCKPHLKLYSMLCRLEHLGDLVDSASKGLAATIVHQLRVNSHLRWIRHQIGK